MSSETTDGAGNAGGAGRGRNFLSGWRGVLLVVRFCAELALLAALAVIGLRLGEPLAFAIVLAVVLPVAAAAVWAVLIGPKAPRRLPDPSRLALELVLFVAAAVALAVVGLPAFAVSFGLVAVATALLTRVYAAGL